MRGSWPLLAADQANRGSDPGAYGPRHDVRERWAADVASGATGPVVVADEVAYAGGDDGTVAALNVTTGESEWEQSLESGVANGTAITGSGLYVTGDAGVVALSSSDGAEQWRTEDGDSRGPPTVANDVLYATAGDELEAWSATGEDVWSVALDGDAWSAPAVVDETVIVASEDGTVTAVTDEGETASEAWSRSHAELGSIEGSPTVADASVYVADASGTVAALDRETGDLAWDVDLGAGVVSSATYWDGVRDRPGVETVSDAVYVGADDGRLYALNASDGDEQWNVTVGTGVERAPPALVSETLTLGTDDDLVGVDAVDGSERWRHGVGDPAGAPAVVDGVAYAAGDGGSVATVESVPLTVATEPASSVSEDSATVGGAVDHLGDAWEGDGYVEYRESGESGDAWLSAGLTTVTDGETFEHTLSGLESGTTYEYRAVVHNDRRWEPGDIDSFTTADPEPDADVAVETTGASDVDNESATLAGELTTLEGTDEADVSFRWREATAADWTNETDGQTVSSEGAFDEGIEGLEPETSYEFQAVAEGGGASDAGEVLTFTTEPDPDVVVESAPATDVESTSATLEGELVELVGADDAEVRFEWRESGESEWTETGSETLSEPDAFEESITGLDPGTSYEFRAVGETDDVSDESVVREFDTAGSWPTFGADVANTGEDPTGAGPGDAYEVHWTHEPGDDVVSGPVVHDGVVYVGHDAGDVSAFDVETGEAAWDEPFDAGSTVESTPTIVDDVVYVTTDGDEMYALDAEDGSEVWEEPFDLEGSAEKASPTVVGDWIYVTSRSDDVYRVDRHTGEEDWRFEESGGSLRNTPAVVDGTVYISDYDEYLWAIDAETGDELWSTQANDDMRYTSPAVADGLAFVGDEGSEVYAFDADPAGEGDQEWVHDVGDEVLTSPVVTDDAVYVGTGAATVVAMDPDPDAAERELWSVDLDGAVEFSDPAYADGVLYVGDVDGGVTAIDTTATEGDRVLWRHETDDAVQSPIAVAGGRIFFGTDDGTLTVLERPQPAVETDGSSDVTATSATLEGTLQQLGDEEVSFEYRATGASEWESTATEARETVGSFELEATDLEPDTEYRFRAVAEGEWEDDHGEELGFTTDGRDLAVETEGPTDVGEESVTVHGDLAELDHAEADVAFQWRPEGEQSWTETEGIVVDETGAFDEELVDLAPGTTYEYRAIAEAGDDVEAGAVRSVTTTEGEVVVLTNEATDVDAESATLHGDLIELGFDEATVSVEWRAEGESAWNETEGRAVDEEGEFEAELTDLASSRTYEFRAVAEADGLTHRGASETFVTELLEVRTDPVADHGSTWATLGGSVLALEGTEEGDVFFEWREVGESDWAETDGETLGETGAFEETIAGLEEGLTYEYRVVGDTGTTVDRGESRTVTTETTWHQFGRDGARTGHHPTAVGPSKLVEQWEAVLDDPVESSPAVVGDSVYVTADETISARYAVNGSERWSESTGDTIEGSPAVSSDLVIAGNNDERVFALHTENGSEAWSVSTEELVRPSPVVEDGTLYVVDSTGSTGRITAKDAETGERQWQNDVAERVEYAPAVGGGMVYVSTSDDEYVQAFNAFTGDHEWDYTEPESDLEDDVSPTYANGTVFIGDADGTVHAIDAATGEQAWTAQTEDDIRSSFAYADDTLYVADGYAGDGRVYAFDPASGDELWRTELSSRVAHSSLAVVDERIYVGTSYDDPYKLSVVDASDGDVLDNWTAGDEIHSSPAIANGVVYVGDDSGSLHALAEPDLEAETLEATDVGERSATLHGDLVTLDESIDAADVAFEYREDGDEEWSRTDPETVTDPTDVEATVTDLETRTTYEFRAVAETDALNDAGEIRTVTTASNVAVETESPTEVGETTATLSGTLTDRTGYDEADVSFQWREEGATTWTGTDVQTLETTGEFEWTLTDLAHETAYEVRAVAETVDETVEGEPEAFWTDPETLSVETGAATDVDGDSATFHGDLTRLEDVDEADVAVQWRAAGEETWSESDAGTLTEPGAFETEVTGLESGAEYEYRAIARADDDTARGTIATVATEAIAVETAGATDVDSSTATLHGDLVELEGAGEAAVSFEWRTDGEETWSETDAGTLTEPGSFAADVTGLDDATTYEYRAVAELTHERDVGDVETVLTDATWRQLGRDGANTGHQLDTFGPTDLDERWAFQTGDDVESAPVVVDDVVYATNTDGHLYALDAAVADLDEAERELWSVDTGATIESSPAVHDGLVVVGTYDAEVLAYDAETGDHVWTYDAAERVRPSITVHDDTLYVAEGYASDGYVTALEPETGDELWRSELEDRAESAAAVGGGLVYVATNSDEYLQAFDAATGDHEWTYEGATDDYGLGAPLYVADDGTGDAVVYAGDESGYVHAVDAAEGTQKWTEQTSEGDDVRSSMAFADETLYVADGSGATGHVYAFDPVDGTERWAEETERRVHGSAMAIVGNYLYVGVADDDGSAVVLDRTAESDRILDEWGAGDWIQYSSAAIVDGVVYVGANDGAVYALEGPGVHATTGDATAVSETSATLEGELGALVGDADATVHFEWRAIGETAWNATDAESLSDPSGFDAELTGLDRGTAYEFRTVAESENATDIGRTVAFTTQALDVETGAATDVTDTSSTLEGTLVELVGAEAATVAVEWRESGESEWSETASLTLTEPADFDRTLTGLEPTTEYEYRATAETDTEDALGEIETVTTDA